MKEILVKVQNKEVVMKLMEYGTPKVVSSIFNIYSLNASEKDIPLIKDTVGVISVEEDDCFELQR